MFGSDNMDMPQEIIRGAGWVVCSNPTHPRLPHQDGPGCTAPGDANGTFTCNCDTGASVPCPVGAILGNHPAGGVLAFHNGLMEASVPDPVKPTPQETVAVQCPTCFAGANLPCMGDAGPQVPHDARINVAAAKKVEREALRAKAAAGKPKAVPDAVEALLDLYALGARAKAAKPSDYAGGDKPDYVARRFGEIIVEALGKLGVEPPLPMDVQVFGINQPDPVLRIVAEHRAVQRQKAIADAVCARLRASVFDCDQRLVHTGERVSEALDLGSDR